MTFFPEYSNGSCDEMCYLSVDHPLLTVTEHADLRLQFLKFQNINVYADKL